MFWKEAVPLIFSNQYAGHYCPGALGLAHQRTIGPPVSGRSAWVEVVPTYYTIGLNSADEASSR